MHNHLLPTCSVQAAESSAYEVVSRVGAGGMGRSGKHATRGSIAAWPSRSFPPGSRELGVARAVEWGGELVRGVAGEVSAYDRTRVTAATEHAHVIAVGTTDVPELGTIVPEMRRTTTAMS